MSSLPWRLIGGGYDTDVSLGSEGGAYLADEVILAIVVLLPLCLCPFALDSPDMLCDARGSDSEWIVESLEAHCSL